jgi:hypothetical protein
MSLGPESYIPIMKRYGVTAVVRLNKKLYDRKKFLDAGIKHYDLYFVDGGNPPDAITKQWLDIVENEKGAVGIHCKAGLGRTGVLNGLFLMKHYRITANEVIAWFRICRPGSVIGPQQQFLKEMEPRMWAEGQAYRRIHGPNPPAGGADLALPPPGWYDGEPPTDDQEEDLLRKMNRNQAPAMHNHGVSRGPVSAIRGAPEQGSRSSYGRYSSQAAGNSSYSYSRR